MFQNGVSTSKQRLCVQAKAIEVMVIGQNAQSDKHAVPHAEEQLTPS